MRPDRRISIVAASPGHVGRIANRMRAADALECGAKGRTPKEALRRSLRASTWACTAMVDGTPHAMFGVVGISLIEDRGRPWFLGSDEVYRHGRSMLLIGFEVLERMHGSFRRLENVVSADNVQAVRLLRRWGFTIEGDATIVAGVPFVRFWRDAGDV